MGTGSPRCYFCGKLIAREEDVRKTEYHVGHGQKMLVMICPACVALKDRGAGPFESGGGAAAVAAVVLLAFILVVFFVFIRPALG